MREARILDQEINIETKRSAALNDLQTLDIKIYRIERSQNKFTKILSAIEAYVELATSREEAEGYLKYALEILEASEQDDFRKFLERNKSQLKNEAENYIQKFFSDNE